MNQKTYWQRLRRWYTVYFGMIFLILSSLLLYIVFQTTQRRLLCEPVQGTIIKSKLKPCDEDGLFSVDIAFRYTVDRIPHDKGKYRDDFVEQCLTEVEAQKILDQYPPGKQVDAWHDPKHPNYALLDPSLSLLHQVLVGVSVGVILLDLYLISRLFRGRPSRSNSEMTNETT